MSRFFKKPTILRIPKFMIPKRLKRRTRKIGLPPGTPVYVGEERKEKVRITVMNYSKEHLVEKAIEDVEECCEFADKAEVTWINVDGIHDAKIIERLGEVFKFHPLILEDIVNTDQRPKVEDYKDYIFIVLKMFYYDVDKNAITSEQVSMILGADYIISFQEKPGDVFNLIRDRIREDKGRIRSLGDDYLAYSLIDAIIDHYYVIMERIGEIIEGIEEELVADPTPSTLNKIYELKKEMIYLRKSIWPLREVVSRLEKRDTPLILEETGRYFRDAYDHTIQVIDTLETYRDILSGMLDLYLSSISNKMNEVMKVLTIIATIFIPLTFIAGIYGMNFDPSVSALNMPELSWPYGYVFTWVIMLVIAALMVMYFKRKRWL